MGHQPTQVGSDAILMDSESRNTHTGLLQTPTPCPVAPLVGAGENSGVKADVTISLKMFCIPKMVTQPYVMLAYDVTVPPIHMCKLTNACDPSGARNE